MTPGLTRYATSALLLACLAACGTPADEAATDTSPTTAATAATDTVTGAETATATDAQTGAAEETSYTMAQVAEHSDASSCWTVIDGRVYDVTEWIDRHPGGAGRIEGLCGQDGTNQFEGQHADSPAPNERLQGFEIGTLAG